jgi:fatty-acyl-CoA synthase
VTWTAGVHSPPTLPELIGYLEGLEEERGLSVYDRRGKTKAFRSYREVARRARGWGAWLGAQGVQPGEVVFLCLNTSHDLVEAFLGVAALGALPCNLALPKAIGGLEVFARRLERLAEVYPGGHLVTTPDVGAAINEGRSAPRPFFTVPAELPDGLVPRSAEPEDLAYIQLTSGSTTTPKAVAISHANLAANARGIYLGGQGGQLDHAFVSWLPLYHDMGLVGIVFTALYCGYHLTLMPPEAFVGTPRRWLEAISEAGGVAHVVTSAPNFGYQWCVDRIPESKRQGLDLSNWRLACCGAEMVRPGTLSAFSARFGPVGFQEGAFAPCYGMAETTLAVTFCPPGRPPRIHRDRVSCGPPIEGLDVIVGDPQSGAPLQDGQEGEVLVRGSSVFQGYYLNDRATADVLREGWFHTGDLGFLHEGELYITGREKDLLVLDGANVAPYELEWVAQEHLPLDGGRAAAFSVERDRREHPVLVAEVKTVPDPAAMETVRRDVAGGFAPLHDLVLVRRGSLPKTSSGKVQRGEVRRRYLTRQLEAIMWQLRPADTEDSR